MNDWKNFLLWRKTWTLVALVILMLSSVVALAATTDLSAFWSISIGAISTILLFAIAAYDWKISADEAADYFSLKEQVQQIEHRINRIERDFEQGQALPVRTPATAVS